MAHPKSVKKTRQAVKEAAVSKPHPQKRVVAGVCAALVFACVAIYGQTLWHGFINFDDSIYVTENPHVQAGLHLKSAGWAFVAKDAHYFHPLTWMSHMLDCSLYGMQPWGHHLTNLVLHSAASVLLFLVLRFLTGALWPSAAAAALFAVHPLHVESVAWIAERKDVLSAFFWMLALGAYGLYARRGGAVRYAAVAAAFALGLMSKPMVVTLPFVLLLLDYWPLGRVDRTVPFGAMARKTLWLAAEKAPLFLMAALSCVSTFVMQVQGKNLAFGEKVPFAARCANAVVVYVLYLLKTAWPSGLAAFYPHPIMRPAWQVAGAAVILAAITLFCLRNFRIRPYLIVGWLWYLGTLVPVIELVQAGDFSHADRYTYLPSIGAFIMIIWGAADLAAARGVPRRVLAAASGAALVALTVCAGIQTSYWRDSGVLFGHAIAVGQKSALAFNNVGALALDQGRYDEARVYFSKALDLDRENMKALANMGVLAGIQDRSDEAKAYLKRALDLDPEDVNTLSNLGRLALNQGRYDEAGTYLMKAVDLKPDHANALFNLGENLMHQGRYDEAQRYLRKALEMAPRNADALKVLGAVLSKLGSREEADRCLKKAEEFERAGADRKN